MIRSLSFFIIAVFTVQQIYCQSLEIIGNGQVIPGDGSNMPQTSDGTSFGLLRIGASDTHSFLLASLENSKPDLEIKSIQLDSPHFTVNAKNRIKIKPGDSKSFEITYEPQSGGYHQALVSIIVSKRGSIRTLTFSVHGETLSEIMISQYYENGEKDVLEVTNLSERNIQNGTYYIGIFNKRKDLNKRPNRIIPIGYLSAGNSLALGWEDLFEGDEVIVLSTSDRNNCFEDRVDVVGVHGSDWGSSRSLAKGVCSSETCHLEFDAMDWTEITLEVVDAADPRQNIFLGRHDRMPLVWDGLAWSNNGLPDRTRKVVISGSYSASLGGIEACDMEVDSQLNFNAGTNNSVVLFGDLSVSGSFEIGDQESLVMYDGLAVVSGNVNKIERSAYRNHKHDLTYWASPVQGAKISTVFSGVNPNRIYKYDQSQSKFSEDDSDYWNVWQSAQGRMDEARGYVAEGIAGTTGYHQIEFTGLPNNGDILTPLFFWDDSNPDNDWNLIGNPYPSAIDIEKFFDVNRGVVDPVVYLWTHATPLSGGDSGDYASDDYATYNYTGGTGIGNSVGEGPVPGKNIGSSQGFFIRTLVEGNAIFTNEMRLVDSNEQFFKLPAKKKDDGTDEKDRIWLNLTTNKGGFNQVLIGFIDNAGPEIDLGYDARRFEGGNPISFYSKIGEDKFVIQAQGSFSGTEVIPLGFTTYLAPRTFQISIGKIEGILKNHNVYIRDKVLEILHDLKSGPYQFQVDSIGDQPDRFNLEFRNEALFSVDELHDAQNPIIYANNGRIHVRSAEYISKIRVYSVLGSMVYESNPDKKNFDIETMGTAKGQILMIDLIYTNGHRLSKKIICQ